MPWKTFTTKGLKESLEELAQADPGEIQQVAAAQIGLLTEFYQTVIEQAKRSFLWALVGVAVGLGFFLGAIVFLLSTDSKSTATISAVAGGIVEVIAGINFVLYGKTTEQLAAFHERLEQTQRFLLANSLTESLDGEIKSTTRAQLVMEIAKLR